MSTSCIQEKRICEIERKNNVFNNDLILLIQRVDNLVGILKVIGIMLGGSTLTAMGFLVTYWVKGG